MVARTAHPPTLADVAAPIGVSRTTVSNAYNRPDQLSPALRERVLDAARELGYNGPDPMARSLRRGRAGSLGLVFDHRLQYIFSDPAAVLFLSGVAANKRLLLPDGIHPNFQGIKQMVTRIRPAVLAALGGN